MSKILFKKDRRADNKAMALLLFKQRFPSNGDWHEEKLADGRSKVLVIDGLAWRVMSSVHPDGLLFVTPSLDAKAIYKGECPSPLLGLDRLVVYRQQGRRVIEYHITEVTDVVQALISRGTCSLHWEDLRKLPSTTAAVVSLGDPEC